MSASDRRLNPEGNLNHLPYFSTNDVIMNVGDSTDFLTYYLPCYVRFLVKEIDKVNAAEMEATISGTLLFSFYYGNIDRNIIEEFVGQENKKAILLEFNQGDSILLKEGDGIAMKQNQKDKIIDFVVRQRFNTNLNGDVFLTPFETLDLYMTVTVQSIHLTHRPGPKIHIKFNCMNSQEVDVLGHGEELQFGHYRIASYFMEAKYTKSRRNPFKPISYLSMNNSDDEEARKSQKSLKQMDDKNQGQIRCFQYAHFRIPIYKFPGIPILTIFLPIEILGVIGLFVFFQEPALGARLATVAVLILAFVAFLPTINDSIPQTPTIKLVDILIVFHLTAILLLAIESYMTKDQPAETFEFVWHESKLYIVSVVINIISFLTIAILFIVHKCLWERRYKKTKVQINRKYKKIVRKHWENTQCDNEFLYQFTTNKVINI